MFVTSGSRVREFGLGDSLSLGIQGFRFEFRDELMFGFESQGFGLDELIFVFVILIF